MPINGLALQPIIQVVDGFKCKDCLYITQDCSNIKKHRNKAHEKKRVADEDLFNPVRLQSWFWEGKERYWIVDESKQQASQAIVRDVSEELGDLESESD